MKIIQGCIGKPNEFIESETFDKKWKIVCQKTLDHWVSYLVEKGKAGQVISIEVYSSSEDARKAIDTIWNTLIANRKRN